MPNGAFIDWVTVRQSFAVAEPLPLLFRGVYAYHTAAGVCVSERLCAQSIKGSWDTAINVQSDGTGLLLSGNVGRFSRPDNVFNHGWRGTVEALDRVCDALRMPHFSGRCEGLSVDARPFSGGAIVSRLDITRNYATGSDAQARAFIRHCSTLNVSRAKRGLAGDESVWWVNSRRTVKVYRKSAELVAHGMAADNPLVVWCRDRGLVRVEVEMKRRELSDADLADFANITDEKLARIHADETEFLTKFNTTDDPDILMSIPAASRFYAAAWLAGQDIAAYASRRTLFRHARVLRDYGIDVFSPRNVSRLQERVRVIELEPVEAPEWYQWNQREG